MTTPRRRVIRPATSPAAEIERRNAAALRRYEANLSKDQVAMRRWMKRLKRAVTAVDKLQGRIGRAEKQLKLLQQL